MTDSRVSREHLEALTSLTAPTSTVAREHVEALTRVTAPAALLSGVQVEVLQTQVPLATPIVSAQQLDVLYAPTPVGVVLGGKATSVMTARGGTVVASTVTGVVVSGRAVSVQTARPGKIGVGFHGTRAAESDVARGGTVGLAAFNVTVAGGRAVETDQAFGQLLDAPAVTDTANYGNGRSRSGSGEDFTLYPVPPLPFHLSTEPRRIMAQQMPRPTIVNGRPA